MRTWRAPRSRVSGSTSTASRRWTGASLACLARSAGEPLGLKTVAAAVGETEDTIEEVFEPHLLRCGFVQKTSRGRRITSAGKRALAGGAEGAPRTELFP
jgi:hypothetical protein